MSIDELLGSPPAAGAAVNVRGLRVQIIDGGPNVVEEVEIDVSPGTVLGLVGESGSGKTTVGMALLGYCRPGVEVGAGRVRIAGTDITGMGEDALRSVRGSSVSYVPQDPGTALNPALRIGTQLRETIAVHAGGMPGAERIARVRETLQEVALPSDDEFLRRYPHELSGGQQQRVAIAMAFVCRPRVIVCDEPTTGLDVTTQLQVLETVRRLCRAHGVAAMYISHDLAVVADIADHVAVMYAGRIVESGPRDEVFLRPRHPYTRRLLRAVPDLHGTRPVVGIPGGAPQPGHRPQGCSFAPRCDRAQPDCRSVFPPVSARGPGHHVRCYHPLDVTATTIDAVPGEATALVGGEALLRIEGLGARHGRRPTLFDIDLDVHVNECVALVGESGSGKTTLARCVAGLHSDRTGTIRLGDVELAQSSRRRSREARQRIQYVFQNPYASLNPRRTVGQTIARQLQLFFPGSRRDVSRRVGVSLEHVALPSTVINRYPDQLSGGERQRVAIARALAAEPALLVCDEVTSALDVSVQAAIIDLLRELRAEMSLSILFITHNLAVIRTVADRVAVMTEGRIVELGATSQVFSSPASRYTQALLANTPDILAVGATAP
jgi:peptide/nickel transport system ATP-binding protein